MEIKINGISFSKKESKIIWDALSKLSEYYYYDEFSLNNFFQQRYAFFTTGSNKSTIIQTLNPSGIFIVHIEQDYYQDVTKQNKSMQPKELLMLETDSNNEVTRARLIDYHYATITLFLTITIAALKWSLELSPNTIEKGMLEQLIVCGYKITNIKSLALNMSVSPIEELFKIDFEKYIK
ncbi:MAG: hypothetical protein NTY74_16330 [Ignavibacteriae bacterium]|nr:hypothetical protein [Ignavibacteriota bacterium]